jgi:tRNA pseudouridine-54 N-methylase
VTTDNDCNDNHVFLVGAHDPFTPEAIDALAERIADKVLQKMLSYEQQMLNYERHHKDRG